MRIYAAFIFLLWSPILYGQVASENLMRVSGFARIAIQPDVAVLNVELEVVDTTMESTIEKLRLQTAAYFQVIKSLGFPDENFKTMNFRVNRNMVSHGSRSKDSGFVASQVIRVEFPFSDSTMNMILTEISKGPDLKLNFDFKLSEELKVKIQKELIELSVANAGEKAKYIIEATGKKIKRIKEIQYDYTPRYGSEKSGMIEVFNGYNKYSNSSGEFAKSRKSFNFQPADLIFEDSVVIFYELK